MCIRDSVGIARVVVEFLGAVDITDVPPAIAANRVIARPMGCLLYTSDAADERSSVDLGGRRIINKKKPQHVTALAHSIA